MNSPRRIRRPFCGFLPLSRLDQDGIKHHFCLGPNFRLMHCKRIDETLTFCFRIGGYGVGPNAVIIMVQAHQNTTRLISPKNLSKGQFCMP